MPGSIPENRHWILNKILEINPETILDVGPGKGTYSDLIKDAPISPIIDGVEIWEPYVANYNLLSKYNKITIKDVREHDDFNYDLVIFGDILEHMTKEDSIMVWEKVSKQARYAIISLPIVYYPQKHSHGNPYEAHVVDNWNHKDVMNTFSNIIDSSQKKVTGAYLAKF
jgi:hypothetical protein